MKAIGQKVLRAALYPEKRKEDRQKQHCKEFANAV